MTAAQFADDYCFKQQGWEINHCWVRVTGTGYNSGWHYLMVTNAYAYRGTILHRIQRRTWGKWRTKKSNTVPAGYASHLLRVAKGAVDRMRAGVWNASGDSYHLSIIAK